MGKLLTFSGAGVFDRLIVEMYNIDFYQQYNILYRLNIITPHFHIREKYKWKEKDMSNIHPSLFRCFQPHISIYKNTLSLYTILPYSVTKFIPPLLPNPSLAVAKVLIT